MLKYLLGAATAFALLASPVPACEDCMNCQHHKDTTAQADKKEAPSCQCKGGDGKCKCGDKCQCGHCKAKGEKTEEPKKT